MNTSVKARVLPAFVKFTDSMPLPARYAGVLPIARLPRLAAALAAPEGELDVQLELRRGARGALRLEGRVAAPVKLVCQRCLDAFDWTLGVDVALRVVTSEDEEARVLQDEEPLLVDGGRLELQAVVEDEVLLALPFAPRCEREACGA